MGGLLVRWGAGLVAGSVLLLGAIVSWAASGHDDEAYALNRDGMIAMSEARFVEAIDLFAEAARLAPDYAITGRPLMYTPIFMQGWASEKLGRTGDACEAYRRYLEVSSQRSIEPTKSEHASFYLASYCEDFPPGEGRQ